jgi:hypothetical protein
MAKVDYAFGQYVCCKCGAQKYDGANPERSRGCACTPATESHFMWRAADFVTEVKNGSVVLVDICKKFFPESWEEFKAEAEASIARREAEFAERERLRKEADARNARIEAENRPRFSTDSSYSTPAPKVDTKTIRVRKADFKRNPFKYINNYNTIIITMYNYNVMALEKKVFRGDVE